MDSRKYIEINWIEKILLFCVGITLPLITLRIELFSYTVTFYLLFMGILILFFYIKKLALEKEQIVFYINTTDIFLLLFFFVITISMLYSVDITYAFKRWSKLLIVVVFYFFLKTMLVEKKDFFEKISKYAVLALPLFIILLAYYYIIVFKADYIGMEILYKTQAGKNSLAFVVAIIIPFSISYTYEYIKTKTYTMLRLLMLIILIAGVILIQSRGLYLVLISYFILYFLTQKISIKNLFNTFIIFFGLILLAINFMSENIKQSLEYRFLSLLFFVDRDGSLTGSSIEVRGDLIERSIELLSEDPFLGVGLGSFMTYGSVQSNISHNDYLLVLSEQGLVGFLLFLLFLGSFVKLAYNNLKRENTLTNQGLFLSICGISIYFLFINAYDNILFWTILAAIGASNININNKDTQMEKT